MIGRFLILVLFAGRVPFIRIGDRCVADFEPIVEEIARRGLRLSSALTDTQRADMHAIMAAVHETLLPAEVKKFAMY